MRHQEETFAGHDGLPLFEQAWIPDGQPRATVVFVHGLLEHSGRHAETAADLVGQGYAMYAMDLRGHGRSEGSRCDVGSFDDYLLDLDIFFDRVRLHEPQRPMFMMGNSMGGLIVSQWAIGRKPGLAGLILTGPLLALADELLPFLRYLAAATALVMPTLRIAKIPYKRLTKEPEMVSSYENDPLCFHGRITSRVGAAVLVAMKRLLDEAPRLQEPLLILHGTEDQVCAPAGSRLFYERVGSKDKTFQLYDGLYHEILDEPEREEVLADLLRWLESRSPNTAGLALPAS